MQYPEFVERVRDWWDRTTNPYSVDHREQVTVDRPDLPRHTPMHYERPQFGEGDARVDPPLFRDGGPRRDEVMQGRIGDCWVLSSLGAVAGHRPESVRDVVREDGDVYRVSLHHARHDQETGDWVPTGRRVEMTVTREVPFRSDKPGEQAGAQITETGVAWAAVLEKAFAGVDQAWTPLRDLVPTARGYARLDQGGTEKKIAEVLTQLTGERAGVIELDTRPGREERTEALLRGQLDADRPVIVGTRPSGSGLLDHGLEPGHAYEVVDVRDGRVWLHNPWGHSHPEPMSVRDFLDSTRGKIATLSPDEARKDYERG